MANIQDLLRETIHVIARDGITLEHYPSTTRFGINLNNGVYTAVKMYTKTDGTITSIVISDIFDMRMDFPKDLPINRGINVVKHMIFRGEMPKSGDVPSFISIKDTNSTTNKLIDISRLNDN